MDKMRILITGGNGFWGQHIQKAMKNADINYLAPKSSELNVLDFEQFSQYIKDNKPTCVLASAAKCGGILANQNSPADFLRDNTQMALNTYEVARKFNITRIYSLGSVCAYGNFCPSPFKEDDLWLGNAPQKTNRPYGQSKRT